MDSASPTTTSWVSFTYVPPHLLPASVPLQTPRSRAALACSGDAAGHPESEHQAPAGHTGAGNWGGGSPRIALGLGPSPCSSWV